jgi:hypothetical protein
MAQYPDLGYFFGLGDLLTSEIAADNFYPFASHIENPLRW